MSFLGTLEQISLPLVLQRIEEHAKTGALVIRQEPRWIEMYFRDGRLICIGPVRPDTTLGDRLLRANVISRQVLQDTLDAIGGSPVGETRLALTLMDLGHITRDDLRAWATKEAASVLELLLTWQQGEVQFEDRQQPPADRLLVSLSLSALLLASASLPCAPSAHVQPLETRPAFSPPAKPSAPVPLHSPASLNIAEFITETPRLALNGDISELASSTSDVVNDGLAATITPPQPVTEPLVDRSVDTSFLRPDMVLLPVDLALLREHNPQIAITPEQYRVITRVDGRTSLQDICLQLVMSVDQMRHVVGQLWAMGLVRFSLSALMPASPQEISPSMPQPFMPGVTGGFTPQARVTVPVQSSPMAAPPSFAATLPFENESQWGNGGNGATFVPGQGWVARPQPLQPLQASSALYTSSPVYATAGR